MGRTDNLVLNEIAERVLASAVINRAIAIVVEKLQPTLEALNTEAAMLKQQRATVETELGGCRGRRDVGAGGGHPGTRASENAGR